MNKKNIIVIITTMALLMICFNSCLSTSHKTNMTKAQTYPKFYEEKPMSIMIMPPINETDEKSAKESLYATLTQTIAESGYYVFPTILISDMLKKNKRYDSEKIINTKLNDFNTQFGADVLLFTIIKRWERQPMAQRVIVEIQYVFKSTKTNKIIYDRTGTYQYSTSSGTTSNNCLVNIITSIASTVNAAITDLTVIADKCNSATLDYDLPKGRYSPKYGTDTDEMAEYQEVKNSN